MDVCKINEFVNKLHGDFPRRLKHCSLKLAVIQFPGIGHPQGVWEDSIVHDQVRQGLLQLWKILLALLIWKLFRTAY